MTPPKAPSVDVIDAGNTPSAALHLQTLKTRPDFLRAARARRQGAGSMMVQARRRASEERPGADVIRVGYTCSKKVGNAVARNRAKRRLREAARAVIPEAGRGGWDYVLIGRAELTAARPFELLMQDLRDALVVLHSPRKPSTKNRSKTS